jgi:hypothetical protein
LHVHLFPIHFINEPRFQRTGVCLPVVIDTHALALSPSSLVPGARLLPHQRAYLVNLGLIVRNGCMMNVHILLYSPSPGSEEGFSQQISPTYPAVVSWLVPPPGSAVTAGRGRLRSIASSKSSFAPYPDFAEAICQD